MRRLLEAGDLGLVEATAVAVGEQGMRKRAVAAEAAGDRLFASRLYVAVWRGIARYEMSRSMDVREVMLRAFELLQTLDGGKDEAEALDLEFSFIDRLRNYTKDDADGASQQSYCQRVARRYPELLRRRRELFGDSEALVLAEVGMLFIDAFDKLGESKRPPSNRIGQGVNFEPEDTLPAVSLHVAIGDRCVDLYKLAESQGDVQLKRLAQLQGIQSTCYSFPSMARPLLESGILKRLDFPRAYLEAVRGADPFQHHRTWFGFPSAGEILLVHGQIAGLLEVAAKACEIWQVYFPEPSPDLAGHVNFYGNLCQGLMTPLVRLGFHGPARTLAQTLQLEWEGPIGAQIERAWNAFSGGDGAYVRLHTSLTACLTNHDSISDAAVRTVLDGDGRERVLALADCWCDKIAASLCMLELCALAAEALGDEELLRFYGERGLDHYRCKPGSRASCRALLGRAAWRHHGDRATALQHWRLAAQEALEEARNPVLVLRFVEDWQHLPGPDGKAPLLDEQESAEMASLVAAAGRACGRSEEELLREFRQAREDKGGGATSTSSSENNSA